MMVLNSIRIENIMPYISGVIAADALLGDDAVFAPFEAEATRVSSAQERNKLSIKERVLELKHTGARQFLSETLSSPYARDHEGAFRNVLNLMESSQKIIENGLEATREISYMQAAGGEGFLDIEGVSLRETQQKLDPTRRSALDDFLRLIHRMEMYSYLSHIYLDIYNYGLSYAQYRKEGVGKDQLLSYASGLTVHCTALLDFLQEHSTIALRTEALGLIGGEELVNQAQVYWDAVDGKDSVVAEHGLKQFVKLLRHQIQNQPYVSEAQLLERDEQTVEANRFYFVRDFIQRRWYAEADEITALEQECRDNAGELVFSRVEEALERVLRHLRSLDAAVGNARLIRDVIRFMDAAKAGEIKAINEAAAHLPSIISDDLVKLSDIRLARASQANDSRKVDNPTRKQQEIFIEKVVNAIPKDDPRRELIRQQLLKQFEEKAAQAKDARVKATQDETVQTQEDPKEEHARNSRLPLPTQPNVGGFELRNEAFNVRSGGIRLEDKAILFTPNQGVNEVLITGATLAILSQTDPDKYIQIEGRIRGVSIVNTARSDLIDIQVNTERHYIEAISHHGAFKVFFGPSLSLMRIHSSIQQDGWDMRTKARDELQKEISMVFGALEEHRKRKLAPDYQSDILSFGGGH